MADERFDVLQSAPMGESRRKCPACSHDRKRHNQAERTLAVNNHGDRVTYHCWHCGAKGAVRRSGTAQIINLKSVPKKEAPPVRKEDIAPLSVACIKYLELRGISRAVAEWAGLKTSTVRGKQGIAYPYNGGAGYKVKSLERDEDGKRLIRIIGKVSDLFLQERINDYGSLQLTIHGASQMAPESSDDSDDPLLILDSVRDISNTARDHSSARDHRLVSDDLSDSDKSTARDQSLDSDSAQARATQPRAITVTEGEEDALSCIEAGIYPAVSVPHGAINADTSAAPDNAKLAIADQPEFWKQFQKINLATDADGNGQAMMAELARRLGRARSFLVNFPDGCKDANDVLVKFGPESLFGAIEGAEPCSIPGLYTADAFKPDLMRLRTGELGKGESTGFPSLDKFFRVGPGITVVTGWPGSGKSDVVDQFNVNLAERLDWSTVYWSPENPPAVHVAKLMEKFARQRFYPGMPNQMSEMALERAYSLVQRNFRFVSLGGAAATVDAVLERFSAAVARWGCRNAVIDPYNAILWPEGVTREDQFIVQLLNKCRDWVNAHEAHLYVVAHPKGDQSRGKSVVNGHSISGGPVWWAKADFGLTVEREDFCTNIHVWKAKHAHMGGVGMGTLQYEYKTASFDDADALISERAGPKLVNADYDEFE